MSTREQRTTIVAMMWFSMALIGIALAASGGGELAIFGLVLIALLSTIVLMREPGQNRITSGEREGEVTRGYARFLGTIARPKCGTM